MCVIFTAHKMLEVLKLTECKKCNHKLSWSDSFRKLFRFQDKVQCPSCQSSQFITKKSQNRMSMIAMAPFLVFIPLVSFNTPTTYTILVEVLCYIAVAAILPFFYEFSNEEEHLF